MKPALDTRSHATEQAANDDNAETTGLKGDTGTGAERRRDPRIVAPMTVIIGDVPYGIRNWSLGGVKLDCYAAGLGPSDRTPLLILLPTAGPASRLAANAEVHRMTSTDRTTVLRFDTLDALAIRALNRYFFERAANDRI